MKKKKTIFGKTGTAGATLLTAVVMSVTVFAGIGVPVRAAVLETYEGQAAVVSEIESRPGMCGRVRISSLQVDVALFPVLLNPYDCVEAQWITDNRDSAFIAAHGGGCLVGDHVNQGFWHLKEAVPGTVMLIDVADHEETWVCVRSCRGINADGILYDADGIPVKQEMTGRYCLYTCDETGGGRISLTFWLPATQENGTNIQAGTGGEA